MLTILNFGGECIVLIVSGMLAFVVAASIVVANYWEDTFE